jgi:hypothetical protein
MLKATVLIIERPMRVPFNTSPETCQCKRGQMSSAQQVTASGQPQILRQFHMRKNYNFVCTPNNSHYSIIILLWLAAILASYARCAVNLGFTD